MKIVKTLEGTLYCPKCLSNKLTTIEDIKTLSKFKHCNCCGEVIYAAGTIPSPVGECPNCGEHTCYDINGPTNSKEFYCTSCGHSGTVYNSTWGEGMDTIKEVREKERKKKEDFIFEMREEINNLTWSIPDYKTQILVENIQSIFNKIIDYIEEN